jgi:alpha-galactosidase
MNDAEATVPGLTLLACDSGTPLSVRTIDETVVELTAQTADGLPRLRLEVDLADAVGYWQPGPRNARTLPPDWAEPTPTSAVHSAPVGALYNAAGEVLLGWAAAEAVAELSVRFGVSEERKSFVVEVRPVRPLNGDLLVVVDRTRDSLVETVRRLGRWLSQRCDGAPLTPPAVARLPVYSTWYTFAQDITADLVATEAARATELGCGSVFVDDGWQRHGHGRGYQGCGDWVPDEDKFPDLASTVQTIHGYGAAVALWVAPLLLGEQSDVYAHLRAFAGHREPPLNCQVLDPRYPEVRAFVAETCLRLVNDYDVDLLKLDFLEQAMAYRDSDGHGDLRDVGRAMTSMLADLRRQLAEAGRGDVVFEFRQPYVSPALARYGQILRANDCPADSHLNRVATLDTRLLSVEQIVHADPMMWGPAGGAEAVAQQLYGGWFAVPQISMRLSHLSHLQATALGGLLALWREHAEVTLTGTLDVRGAERGYDLVRAIRPDLGRSVIARYAPIVVDLDERPTSETAVLNATPHDRLILRTSRPIIGGVARAATAAEAWNITPSAPGLVELAVPPYGTVTITS